MGGIKVNLELLIPLIVSLVKNVFNLSMPIFLYYYKLSIYLSKNKSIHFLLYNIIRRDTVVFGIKNIMNNNMESLDIILRKIDICDAIKFKT